MCVTIWPPHRTTLWTKRFQVVFFLGIASFTVQTCIYGLIYVNKLYAFGLTAKTNKRLKIESMRGQRTRHGLKLFSVVEYVYMPLGYVNVILGNILYELLLSTKDHMVTTI